MDIKENSRKLIGALDEISRYKLLTGPGERKKQKIIYVDPLPDNPVINKMLNIKKRNKVKFLIGRRGTGKTTIMNRARIEGFESFLTPKTLEYWYHESDANFLPIYIDINSILQKVKDSIKDDIKDRITLFSKRIFLEIIDKIKEFVLQINVEKEEIITNSQLKQISKITENFKKDLEKEVSERRKSIGEKVIDKLKDIFSAVNEIGIKDVNIRIDYDKEKKKWMNVFPTNLFLKTIGEIKDNIPNLDFIYILIDEFSEINDILQDIVMNGFINPLYRDSDNQYIYFCIGCYPALYNIGNLSIGSDCDLIELDWFKLYQNKQYTQRLKYAIEYMKSIISKRVNYYFNGKFKLSDIFDESDDFYHHLYFATMNIPRFIGEILRTDDCRDKIIEGSKIKTLTVRNASKKVYDNELVLNYFVNKMYFPEDQILNDKELWDWLNSKFRATEYRNKKAIEGQGLFFVDKELFEKFNNIFIRLEMMGFLFVIDDFKSKHPYSIIEGHSPDYRRQSLYCIYYGASNFYDLKFPIKINARTFRERDSAYHFTKSLLQYQEKKEFFECEECKNKVPMVNAQLLEFSNFFCTRTEKCRNNQAKYKKIYNPTKYLFVVDITKEMEEKANESEEEDIKLKLKIFRKHKRDFKNLKISESQLLILSTLYSYKNDFFTAKDISKTKRITPQEYTTHKIASNIRKITGTVEGGLRFVEVISGRGSNKYRITERGISYIEYLKALEQLKGV